MAQGFDEIFGSFGNIMSLLRDLQFQDLLENYERAKRTFLVGYEVQDEVSSEIIFKVKEKGDLGPDDYLTAFSDFVKTKENEIEAISVVLNKPAGWNTKTLNDLRKTLTENDFPEYELRRAYKAKYQKQLVDIISMVKHAARETEPLLSPAERVERAIQRVTSGLFLTEEQSQWMGYIREHLKQNMSLGEDDLQDLPIFADRGGLARFRKVFPEINQKIITEINTAIAA